jgi:4-hydroxy-2-oxoheptanedioate aldolase
MRINKVKAKLRRGRPSIGSWLTLGNLHAARVLARCGFDWLALDVEHAPYDWREIANAVGAIADAGCVPLVRVPDSSHSAIKRALDAGAYGVIVPMINTVEQAKAAIAAAKYPPEGNRGVGIGMHNLNFDCSVDEYYLQANNQILVILQTESPEGIQNARSIYDLPGCDAIFIGPNDLRFRMRNPAGDFPSEQECESQLQRIIQLGRDAGRPTGTHVTSASEASLRIEQGMQLIAVSSDLSMLVDSARATVAELGIAQGVDIARY